MHRLIDFVDYLTQLAVKELFLALKFCDEFLSGQARPSQVLPHFTGELPETILQPNRDQYEPITILIDIEFIRLVEVAVELVLGLAAAASMLVGGVLMVLTLVQLLVSRRGQA